MNGGDGNRHAPLHHRQAIAAVARWCASDPAALCFLFEVNAMTEIATRTQLAHLTAVLDELRAKEIGRAHV